MRLLQLSDTHLFRDPRGEIKGVRPRERFDRLWELVQREYSHVDRLIVTGDLTHDEELETYQILAETWQDWRQRLRVIPGNHDDRGLMRQVFSDRVDVIHDRNVFHEELGGWRFIGLDSHLPGSVAGELGILQLQWLEDLLQTAVPLPTFLFVHHPAVAVDSTWLNAAGLQDGTALIDLLQRFAHVRGISSGHVHQERLILERGILQLTVPSTGVQFKPETETLEVDSVDPGFRLFEFKADGSFQTRVQRVRLS